MQKGMLLSGVLLPTLLCALLAAACNKSPAQKIGGIVDTPVVDTRVHIRGWEHAGAPVTDAGLGDIVRCGNRLFVKRGDGAILTATIPEFNWLSFPLPDGDVVSYYINGDSTHVWFPTDRHIWEYDCATSAFADLVGDLREFADTTLHWTDTLYTPRSDSLRFFFNDVIRYKNDLYATSYNFYGNTYDNHSNKRIMRYVGDGHWVRADSTFVSSMPDPIFVRFIVAGEYLWLTTGNAGDGLFRYDGTRWEEIPGTTQFNYNDATIGWNAESVAQHLGSAFIGTKQNGIWQLTPDGRQLKDSGVYRYNYQTDTADTFRTVGDIFTLAEVHGLLIAPEISSYRDDATGMWRFLLQNNADTLWVNADGDTTFGPVFVQPNYNYTFGLVTYGDTLIATASDFYGEKGGVYFLDLNKIAWYRAYKANGYRF